MRRTVLITLGRLPKALDLCRSFANAGWRVVVAEPHARHLCGASRSVVRSVRVPPPSLGRLAYLEALAEVARQEGAQLVVPVSEETLHVASLPELLPGMRVLTMDPQLVLALHHKGGFVALAREIGVAAPETHPLGSAEAVELAATGRVVVKPVHSCSGRGVRMLAEGDPLPKPDPASPAIVQRHVAGAEFSTCTLAHAGRVLGTVVYRGVVFSGSVAVAFERVTHAAIEDWITRAVEGLAWSGFIAFDLLVDRDGRVFGVECNPRTTSGLHFFHPDDLAPAIADPDRAPPMRFRAETRLQQFWSCLTETQLSLFRRDGAFPRNLRGLLTTRDVCWRGRDPLPLLTMPYTAWPILREAARRRVTFGEVATLDVGWAEEAAPIARDAAPARAASRTSMAK